MGSSSNIGCKRFDNYDSFLTYFASIENGELPIKSKEILSKEEKEKEYILLNLRLIEGFSIDEINDRFGIDFMAKYEQPITKHLETGLISIEAGRFKFTKKGLDIGNQFYLDIV